MPNVIPEYGKVWLWLRDWQRSEMEALLARVRKVAEGAAIMTETKSSVTIQTGSWEILTNETGARMLDRNLRWLGPVTYTDAEQAFARAIQKESGVPEAGLSTVIEPLEGQKDEGGSSDVGDVSWVVPSLGITISTVPRDAPWHAWPVVATSGMSIGHKGLVLAAKTLAATMVDLYEDPAALQAVRAEFEKKKGSTVFQAYLPPGPPPIPK